MKSNITIVILLITATLFNCSNSVEYSETFKKHTTGKYLYNADELILVYYEGNNLRLNWKGGKIEPVTLEENEFFIPDMYKKFRFVEHPDTKEWYLSIIDKDDDTKMTYDYVKVSEEFKTPSQHLESGNYEEALAGFLEIKQQDSLSSHINEWNFNRIGYRHIRNKEYDKAIGVLNMNTKLYPNSSNVYDSLADAYLISGDSALAYTNYKVALEKNTSNERAKQYIKAYESKK